jgi:hypothetical protein
LVICWEQSLLTGAGPAQVAVYEVLAGRVQAHLG